MNSAFTALLRRAIPRAARNWLRSPRQSVAWARDEWRHRLGWDDDVTLRPGWTMRAHPAADRLAYHVCRTDPAQSAELDAFIAVCRPGMVLFDAGAHFGLFTFAALHYGGPTAVAVAVEPSPLACRLLAIQAEMNHVTHQLTVIPSAAGQAGAVLMLPLGVTAAGYFVAESGTHPASDLTRVPSVSLDDVARSRGIWPTHVKIDVEGAEADVLRGARAVLTHDPAPVVLVELHSAMVRARGGDPDAAPRALADLGYRLTDSSGTAVSPADATRPPLARFVARRAGGA